MKESSLFIQSHIPSLDCWSIDMNRRDKWIRIWNGSMHRQVWKGLESDDESNLSTDRENNNRSDDDEEEDEEVDDDLNQYTIVEEDGDSSSTDMEKEDRKFADLQFLPMASRLPKNCIFMPFLCIFLEKCMRKRYCDDGYECMKKCFIMHFFMQFRMHISMQFYIFHLYIVFKVFF